MNFIYPRKWENHFLYQIFHPVQISSKVKDVNKINSHVSFYFLPSLQLFLLISKKKIV